MIGILADPNMGRETRPGAATFDRARRQRGLDEAFAAGAGQTGPDDAVQDEAADRARARKQHCQRSPELCMNLGDGI
jgi:hypothetical protein